MTTLETIVKKRLEDFGSEEEKIDFLLKAAPFLRDYESMDDEISPVKTLKKKEPQGSFSLEDFVDISEAEPSKRRGILVRYLREVEHIPVDTKKIGSTVPTSCSACGGRVIIDYEQSATVCEECGLSERFLECSIRNVSYNEEMAMDKKSQFSYKRLTHLNQWIDALQAKENTTIPEEVIDAVRNEFKKHRMTSKSDITPKRVKMFLKKLNLSRWYEHTHNIVNMINGAPAIRLPQDLEDRLKRMFLQVQQPFEKHRPKDRKNFLNYGFTLYKLCQLLGEDEYLPLFPLLKSTEKLRAQDMIWKAICEELKWEYIPTV